jgi:ADP-ribose pyrophosphatase YjhB (NUDIX family)
MMRGSQARVQRWLYRAASRLLQAYRFVWRPTVRGVRCVPFHEDEVLLVRHTYGDRAWSFPGGLAKRREAALQTSKRELAEELGIKPPHWRYLGELQMAGVDHARHVISCYACALDSRAVEVNTAEIDQVGWYPLGRLPEEAVHGTAEVAHLARAVRGPEEG